MIMDHRPAREGRPLLLCLSHLRWNFVLQRPQHLLQRAAADFHVIYVEEPLFEEGAEPDLRLQWQGLVLVATPVMAPGHGGADALLKDEIARLVEPFEGRPRVIWYYTPMALPLAQDIQADCVLYDCMDELSAFRFAPARLQDLERDLMAACDLVFTGGVSLYEAKRPHHRRVHCFPSSIDTAHFGQARQAVAIEPDDQAGIARPRIGFFGVIDERLDIALLGTLAARRPDWHFVMIGPVVKIDPADLPRPDNIHWLGRKDYAELPAYLRGWDAGFMPFAINEATRFISPTKTPEFLAAGLPVVSTAIRDVIRSYGAGGLVEIAADADEMEAAIAAMLAGRDQAWLDAVDQHLALSSWDATWEQMRDLIKGVLSPDRTTPLAPKEFERPSHV